MGASALAYLASNKNGIAADAVSCISQLTAEVLAASDDDDDNPFLYNFTQSPYAALRLGGRGSSSRKVELISMYIACDASYFHPACILTESLIIIINTKSN